MVLIWVITGYFVFNALYILWFSVASVRGYQPKKSPPVADKKVAILIPVYLEDEVILNSIKTLVKLTETNPNIHAIVVSDSLQSKTIGKLRDNGIQVSEIDAPNRTKAKALFNGLTMLESSSQPPDIIVVLDADNIIEPDFITTILEISEAGSLVIQGRRRAKPTTSILGILDTFSAEINNNIFRKGQRVTGFSSSLAGSGMVFSYAIFRKMMHSINLSSCGEDKEMELYLLKNRINIEYAGEAVIFDEKIQHSASFIGQRKRWLYAQFEAAGTFGTGCTELIKNANIDLFNKNIQMLLLPRVLLLFFAILGGVIALFAMVHFWIFIWAGIVSLIGVALIIAIPGELYKLITFRLICMIPYSFFLMICALIGIKSASKTFIHTNHRCMNRKKR